MQKESIVLNAERNVTLTAYLQEVGGEFHYVQKRPAVLILPGGGYQMCSDREAEPVAFAYLKAGYQAFILRYSIGMHSIWPNPLEDYEQAMGHIRDHADAYTLYADKIAVIGFSAGGHLAACAAVLSKNRPNAAILGYAVVGEDVKGCNQSAPDVIPAVSRDTCPCFLFSSRTDNVVPVSNSIRFMHALTIQDVAFESHIYAYGPHGFSTYESSVQDREPGFCERIPHWVDDSIGWLKDVLGDFSIHGMTEPKCPVHTNADGDRYLSVDCTFDRLMKNQAAGAVLAPIITGMQGAAENADKGRQMSFDDEMAKSLARRMTLKQVLSYGNVPQAVIDELDEQLRKIENL